MSTFKYSALILIINIHERTLRLVYQMEDAGFGDLLQKGMHHNSCKQLAELHH